MANKYAGTQTEKNLEAAFAGESMARNKYTYYASKAKKEGFEQIAALFLKTAENRNIFSGRWLKRREWGPGRGCDLPVMPRPGRLLWLLSCSDTRK